jgi:hypothetical protein
VLAVRGLKIFRMLTIPGFSTRKYSESAMRAVKQINGLRGENYEQKLKEVGLETLESRRNEADMMLVYKILNGKTMINDWFELAGDRYDGGTRTRAASERLRLREAFAHTDIRKNFFTVRVSKAWNRLPDTLRTARTPMAFKNGYRQFTTGETNGGDGRRD